MGLVLYCKKTHRNIDLSSGGFLRLRLRVAQCVNQEFYEHYQYLLTHHNWTDEEEDAFNAKTSDFIKKRKVSIKIVDFLYQSDIEGRIAFGACKQLLKAIGDYTNDYIYGYIGMPNPVRFQDFKDLLQECVDNRSDLVWR